MSDSISVDNDAEVASIILKDTIIEGDVAVLHIEFTGVLGDNMKGFYRSKYKSAKSG